MELENSILLKDIYDENNYCLARAPGISSHDNVPLPEPAQAKEGDASSKKTKIGSSCSQKKMTIVMIICVLVMGVIGGLVAFILLSSSGMLKFQSRFL